MNEAVYIGSLALFYLSAPTLLAARIHNPKRMPRWMLLILSAALGWAFANLAVLFYFRHLDEMLVAAGGVEGASQELVNAWQNDGAKRVFALLFGWLYGLIYLGVCVVIVLVASAVRRKVTHRGRADRP